MLLDRVDIVAACAECPRDRGRQHLVQQELQRCGGASTLEGGLTSEPGGVGLFALTPVQLNPLVDLVGIGAVVRDRGMDEPQRYFQVIRSGARVTVVVPDDGNHLPHVHPSPDQAGPTPRDPVDEAHQRMVLHAQPFLHVTLSKRPRRQPAPTGVCAKLPYSCFRQAETQRLTHVSHGSTTRYMPPGAPFLELGPLARAKSI